MKISIFMSHDPQHYIHDHNIVKLCKITHLGIYMHYFDGKCWNWYLEYNNTVISIWQNQVPSALASLNSKDYPPGQFDMCIHVIVCRVSLYFPSNLIHLCINTHPQMHSAINMMYMQWITEVNMCKIQYTSNTTYIYACAYKTML